jgi:TRAP-type C4-dicarboxylate transport system substrate-binding protein
MRKFTLSALLLPFVLVSLAAGSVAAQEPQNLSFMITRSNLNAFDNMQHQAAFDRIAERTSGRLSIQTIFSGSLSIKNSDWFRAVGKGDLAMSMIVGDYHAGDFPMLGLLQTPFLFRDQVEKNLAIAATFPIMQREANKLNVQLLANIPFGEVGFWTTEPIDDISKMDGVKLRAQAKLFSDMVEAIGGVPVPVAWAEAYTALQRGVAHGIFTGYESFTGANLQEVAPYAHRIFLSNQVVYVGINKDQWDAVRDADKVVVMEELGRASQIIQANIPNLISAQIEKQREGGLKGYAANPPAAWFDIMAEKVASPTLKAELERSGDVGLEMVAAMEAALGRPIMNR